MSNNEIGLCGIDFVEFSTDNRKWMHGLFQDFGFSKMSKHKNKNIDLYSQNQITFLLNYQEKTFGYKFQEEHGPSISSMGWKVKNAKKAFDLAVKRGARPFVGDYKTSKNEDVPAIYGIGDSLIYFIEDTDEKSRLDHYGFSSLQDPEKIESKGFILIDHLTNNVYKGSMEKWASFYKDIFDFKEVRYFDIKGSKTGLTSYALRSPDGSFCIPINEASDKKSQINEYLEEYNGPGIQHLAFLTDDILKSLTALKGSSIKMLDIDESYYKTVFDRVPNVKENKKTIEDFNVLVDGDDEGYLLQIFTKNIVGPIFIELIQRNNHLSFGEGNFQALFESIEKDQMKRGVL